MTRRRLVLAGIAGLLVLVGVAAWLYMDGIPGGMEGGLERPSPTGEVSPELARHAEERLRAFAAGEDADSLVLAPPAVQSLLRYRGDGFLPSGVGDPEVAFTDSTAVVAATLRLADLPDPGAAERLRGMLGDTAGLRAEVVPELVQPSTARIRVRKLEAGGVTVPDLFLPTVLRRSGVPVDDGYPRSVVFRVPGRLIGIAIRDSQLVLRRASSGRTR